MSRTTAFPATSVLRLIAAGRIRKPGVHAPEMLASMPGIVDAVLADQRARGVKYVPWMEEGAKAAKGAKPAKAAKPAAAKSPKAKTAPRAKAKPARKAAARTTSSRPAPRGRR
jgi:hypothetical protein